MERLPREPEAFTEQVMRLLAEPLGNARIEFSGPLELHIDDRAVDLTDLYRAIHNGERPPEQAIEHFVEAYLEARRLEETPLPFEMIRSRILPRIQPSGFFKESRAEFYACQPFINDTLILYMIDVNGVVTPVTTEQLIRWGIGVEDLDELARRNLAAHEPDLELKVFQGDEGTAALFNAGDGYDASRLLLNHLYPQLAPELGGNFLVAIPTRDVFVAFPTEPDGFVGQLKQRIAADYRKLPYPITDNLFLVTLDGVASWDTAA